MTQAHYRPALFDELDRCRVWIEAALKYSGGTHDWYDIVAGVLAGNFQLWPKEKSALIMEIITYPRKRVLNVFLGGGDLTELASMHDEVIEWAKKNGCTGAIISGRKGWQRAYERHGWAPLHVTLQKEFEA